MRSLRALLSPVLLCSSLLFNSPCRAQQDTTLRRWGSPQKELTLDILAGGNVGHYTYAELGLARRLDGTSSHHPFTSVVFVGVEALVGPKIIYAPKAGAWIGGGAAGMNLGINALWYTNGTHADPCLRPEIGIGFGPFKAVYGYNIKTNNLDRVNSHVFAVAVLFTVKRLGTRPWE